MTPINKWPYDWVTGVITVRFEKFYYIYPEILCYFRGGRSKPESKSGNPQKCVQPRAAGGGDFWYVHITLPETNSSPLKWMVGIQL